MFLKAAQVDGATPGEQASPRGASPMSVPVEVEVELRAAAGQAVAAAAASSRPPVGAAGAAEETRSMERRLREERQAALAAQKRVCCPPLYVRSCSWILGRSGSERT